MLDRSVVWMMLMLTLVVMSVECGYERVWCDAELNAAVVGLLLLLLLLLCGLCRVARFQDRDCGPCSANSLVCLRGCASSFQHHCHRSASLLRHSTCCITLARAIRNACYLSHFLLTTFLQNYWPRPNRRPFHTRSLRFSRSTQPSHSDSATRHCPSPPPPPPPAHPRGIGTTTVSS